MNFLEAPLVLGIIGYFTYMVFELFARKSERLKIIEKMGENFSPIDTSALSSQFSSLLPSFPKKSFTSLRFGSLLSGLGLGLLIGVFLVVYFKNCYHENSYELTSICYTASLLLFGGLGLIISYILEKKEQKKE
ncbi:MAG: hypothetical protein LBR18_04755 [Tannerella sp.]|jgi:hypothetical protein|nr:hypothetical protein [Tannerella sp.]